MEEETQQLKHRQNRTAIVGGAINSEAADATKQSVAEAVEKRIYNKISDDDLLMWFDLIMNGVSMKAAAEQIGKDRVGLYLRCTRNPELAAMLDYVTSIGLKFVYENTEEIILDDSYSQFQRELLVNWRKHSQNLNQKREEVALQKKMLAQQQRTNNTQVNIVFDQADVKAASRYKPIIFDNDTKDS